MSEQMKRGVSQALYKYLPGSWIDFSVRGKARKNYIAHVERWNSEKLTNINKKRLLRVINQLVKSFGAAATMDGSTKPATVGYGTGLTNENCSILTPKSESDERGIIADISPLTFYCKKCMKVHQFQTSDQYRMNRQCKTCGIELTQLRQIYYCKCGWATDKHPVICPHCRSSKNVYWNGKYNFYCKTCGHTIQMRKTCEECGAQLWPKVALDPAQYFALSLNLIDLISEDIEDFLSNSNEGVYLVIAYWLGKISREELLKLIDKGITTDPEKYQKIYDEQLQMFTSIGLDEVSAALAAEASAAKECGTQHQEVIKWIQSEICSSRENLVKSAEMLIEYDMVCNLDEISTIEEASIIAKKLNTNANPELFRETANCYGIKDAQVCGNIPFISCSFGFTRGKTTYEPGVQLRAFKEERVGIKNVYASKLNTEGVIFEFDRKMILQWLVRNKYIESDTLPDLENDAEVKIWFLNNIYSNAIDTFSEIDSNQYFITSKVYGLVHSISHLIIRGASEICGLDKNSLSEYIFIGVPAVLIYCQNSQGFNLGALFNIFQAYFDHWLKKSLQVANHCIFDPICLDRYKACTGCLFLNEVSCQHFNKDLDRSLVIGKIDKQTKERFYGFWEDL